MHVEVLGINARPIPQLIVRFAKNARRSCSTYWNDLVAAASLASR